MVLSVLVTVNLPNNANALSQTECVTLTNLGSTELGYTVVTCDNPFNVTVNMGQRLHIQNPTGGSHNMLPSASYGNPGTYQFSSASTGVVGTSGIIKLQNPPDIGVSLQNVQVSFSGSQMSVSGNIVNSNNFPVKDLYVYWHVTDSSGNYLSSWQRYGGGDGQAYSAQIPAQSTGTFSETMCCGNVGNAVPYIVQAFRDDGTKLISINNPPVITVNSPSSNPNSTIEGNNPELKIIVTGTVQNKISGKDNISVTFTDPKGVIVYQKSLTLNSQGDFNNEFENPLYIKDMRDSGLYHAKFVYDAVTKEFDWNYLTSVYTSPVSDTTPPVVVVPNNKAIQATSNNPSPVTFSVSASDNVDGNLTPSCSRNSGSNFPIGLTTVTCTATDKAGNSASKSFTITVTYDEPALEPESEIDSNAIQKYLDNHLVIFANYEQLFELAYDHRDYAVALHWKNELKPLLLNANDPISMVNTIADELGNRRGTASSIEQQTGEYNPDGTTSEEYKIAFANNRAQYRVLTDYVGFIDISMDEGMSYQTAFDIVDNNADSRITQYKNKVEPNIFFRYLTD